MNAMRKPVTTLIVAIIVFGAVAESSAQLLVMYETKADDFIRSILEHHVGIDGCPNEFDPRVALQGKDIRLENYSYWRERDPLTPGGENHVQQWNLPGVTITAFTFFGDHGPSTWLSKVELSDASAELDGNLKVGDTIDRFAKLLELSASMKSAGRLVTSRANVTFQVNDEGKVTRIVLECVPD